MSDEVLRNTHGEPHQQEDAVPTKLFGFWIYIMSDAILFAVLFATYAVLHGAYAGGPTGKEIFDLRGVLIETLFLLVSSFTYGLSTIALRAQKRNQVLLWLAVTFAFGAAFVGMELNEFAGLIAEGNGPGRSAFLSAFFTLVSTHGLHVSIGLLWMAILIVQVFRKGLTEGVGTRLMLLSLFWHFLDIIWIGVFTIVYLMGAM
ncbi:cytochrome o ubiquinol oxidase subunit III [Salinispira pacifica]